MDAVAARFLTGLNSKVGLIDSAAAVTYVDIDDTIRRTYGYAKQGSGYGYSAAKGLNALIGTVSSGGRAPVIVATRLRKGSANSARGAARLVADSLKTTPVCGAGGTVILRAGGTYYGRDVMAVARRGGAHFGHHRTQGPRRHRRYLEHPRGRMDEDPLLQSDSTRN